MHHQAAEGEPQPRGANGKPQPRRAEGEPQPRGADAEPHPHRAVTADRRAHAAELRRRLGTTDAVVVGLGAMLGAGVFSAFTPAAQAAGAGLLLGLVLAAALAYANATSSARLAAMYPMSGGTYVYGRERLGRLWGYLAGWSFVTGKIASCAAMALTVGHYVVPAHPDLVAVTTIVAILGVNYFGVRTSARLTWFIVVIVLVVLASAVGTALVMGPLETTNLAPHDLTFRGVLQSAGFLFFAFAGYARIATLGEEVIDPQRVIPRAIRISFILVLSVYALTAVALLGVLGASGLAETPAPVSALVATAGAAWLEPLVRATAALAAAGALLALILGVSRTTFAMARDGYLPSSLRSVSDRFGGPYRAELAVGLVVAAVVVTVDVQGAIGFSSFLVLVYYAITNGAALTLRRRHHSVLPVLGLVGCLLIALSLPLQTIAGGVTVLVVGIVVWRVTRTASSAVSPNAQ